MSKLIWQKDSANIVLVVILVVVAVAAGYYFLKKPINVAVPPTPTPTPTKTATPTPSETVNWKTYSNSSVGFELKYPTNWDLSIESTTNAVLLTPPANRLEQPTEETGGVSIVVELNPDKLDLQSYLTNSTKYYSQSEADKMKSDLESGKTELGIYYHQKEITIDSKPALDQYLDGEGGSVRYIFIPFNDKIIVIAMGSDFHFIGSGGVDSRIKNLVDTFDKIPLTFRFTKQPTFCPPAPSCEFFIVFGNPPIFSNGCINYVCPETPVLCGTPPPCQSPLIIKLPDPRPGLPVSCLADYATCVLPQ